MVNMYTTYTIQRAATKQEIKRRTHWTSLILYSGLKREEVLSKLLPGQQVYAVTPNVRQGFDATRELIHDHKYFRSGIIESDKMLEMFESWGWSAFHGDKESSDRCIRNLSDYRLSARRICGKIYISHGES